MKKKAISIITIIASVAVVTMSIIYLTRGFMIPALSPFFLCVVMFGLWYQYKDNYTLGKVNKKAYTGFSVLFGIAGLSNIVAGVAQLMNIKNKPSIAIIGGADGPTAIYLSGSLSPVEWTLIIGASVAVIVGLVMVLRKLFGRKK